MSEELLEYLPVWGCGKKGMTRSEVADEAGIEYEEAKRNLEELYRKRLIRRKAVEYRYWRVE